jgi:hypothetical protein
MERFIEASVFQDQGVHQNIYIQALNIISEKKTQELEALKKVKPQARNILKRLITRFDLDNPSGSKTSEIIQKYFIGKKDFLSLEDKQNFIQELKELLTFRGIQIKNWVSIINGI